MKFLKIWQPITLGILLGLGAPSHAIEEVIVTAKPLPKCGVGCQQIVASLMNSYKDASSADIAKAASNSLSHQEYKEETDEDRCSDEYKDYADSVCRSAAGHSLMDRTMMCRFEYGPRDSAMYLAKDPGFVAALAKAVGKKALSWGEIVSESFSLGNTIAENTLARRHEICNDNAQTEYDVKNLECDQIQKEREYQCSR